VGEAACNGIHGANRLASNSLLEGLVFGRRIARSINDRFAQETPEARAKPPVTLGHVSCEVKRRPANREVAAETRRLQARMTLDVGIIRNAASLLRATGELSDMLSEQAGAECTTIEEMELRNMTQLASLVAAAATARTESRGAHYRDDYPQPSEDWMLNLVI
jgi:L-aspartate oxidase